MWDRDLPGFGVRVHASGRKSYIVQARGPAGSIRLTIGRHGEISAREARKDAAAIIYRIKRGEDPRPAAPRRGLTVADLADRYLRLHAEPNCKSRSVELYRVAIDKYILPALGATPVRAVEQRDVAALHHQLHDKPAMANSVIRVLSQMFRLAERWGLAREGSSPCRLVRLYKLRARDRFLSPEEYRRVGRVLREMEAEGSAWPPAIAALRLLMLTGCRRDEILTLRWDDVDRTAARFRLRDSKTGPRIVILTRAAQSVLARLSRFGDNPWLIPGARPGSRLLTLKSTWKRVRTRAGIEDVRLHDLRHSYASRALAMGESLTMIGRLLNHAQAASTARYAHLMRDTERAAASRVGDSIARHIVSDEAEAA